MTSTELSPADRRTLALAHATDYVARASEIETAEAVKTFLRAEAHLTEHAAEAAAFRAIYGE